MTYPQIEIAPGYYAGLATEAEFAAAVLAQAEKDSKPEPELTLEELSTHEGSIAQ